MNRRLVSTFMLGFALSAAAVVAQNDAPNAQYGAGPGGGQRGFGAVGGAMGRGVTGTVTEIAADHYNIKTQNGEKYTIHYSVNTRFMKQPAGAPGQGNASGAGRRMRDDQEPGQATMQAGSRDRGMMGGPPQQIKSTDIKVGDAIAAMGEVDSSAKSVGAMAILQLDPERARQMEQLQANYGKTWLLGKVTAINEVQVTLLGSVDNAPHTFVADENTTFRERNNPITLADIHVDDVMRVEGSLKDGVFTATAVNVMRPPAGARVPRNAPPPQ
jgi:hypothetical protein